MEILNFYEQVSSTHLRKLTQFYFCIFCEKNILSFNISMDDMVSMKMCQTLKEKQTFLIFSFYHYHECGIVAFLHFYPSQTLFIGKSFRCYQQHEDPSFREERGSLIAFFTHRPDSSGASLKSSGKRTR